MSIQHSVLGNTEYQHTPYRWVVANQAAREALTPTAADVGKLLLQESDQTTWVLVAHSPATWQGFATQAQGAKADTAVQPSRTISPGSGLQGGGDLSQNRTIGLDAGAIAALNLAATAVQPAAIAGFEAGSELNARDAANRDRANHTGTQPLSTISDAGTAAANNTGDFATAAQGAKADSAVQPAAISNFETATELNARDTANRDRANHTGTQTLSTISDAGTAAANNTGDFATAAQGAKADSALQPDTAITVTTINTGVGDVECWAMNQNVRTTDTPTFGNATADGHALNRVTADGRYGQLGSANSWTGDQDVAGGISATNQITGNDGFVADGTNLDFDQAGIIIDYFAAHGRITVGSDGGNSRNMIIRANNAGTPNPNQIMVHSSGNVGLGDATPENKLTVVGDGSFTSGVTPATGQDALTNLVEDTYTATLTPTTSGTVTLNSNFDTLRYTRINGRCYVSGHIEVGSVSSPLGGLALNLPFASAALPELSERSGKIVVASGLATKNGNELGLIVAGGTANANFYLVDGASFGTSSAPEMQANTVLVFDFSYPV